ncbi:sensor histidine kinase [Sphingomonas panacisoli]|uniref:histidine kinase n=1 Tax=Sphingomonas panacisoli TaxID=1813879 RepID=A0A5B8LK17_9SPHN|nr:sensor histidine kinase [Sphingomonas panacisoli]QDZ07934.1 sensor histidine kinase [Sphingomonas panacisoli]
MKIWRLGLHGGSLTARLLRSMVLPMAGVALLLGFGGAIAIRGAVQAVSDRILGAASRAIAESLNVEDGEVALNLSPAIFGMLEDNERDNVYYSVTSLGKVVTGYSDLPNIAPRGLRDTEVVFSDAVFKGRPVRIVAEGRRLPGIGQPVIVEVAETLGARERIVRRLLIGLAILEAALIGLTAVLLPVAVRWGMRPLIRLRAGMDQRLGSDLQPLPTEDVPVELRDLVRAFNGMLARLDATLEGMRRFTADASHQMRTPLSILRTHIALLRKAPPDSEDAAHSIDDIDHASARLQRLLVQLLALARADNAAVAPEAAEMIEVNDFVATVASDHAADAVREGIELKFERAATELRVITHPGLCAELIGNLIDNAIRYNRPAGSVEVSIEPVAGGADIVIEDDGPGISIADREKVFTRFTRLDRDNRRPGSGLGLPIARALAEAIGATLRLDTARSGQGLRVTVGLRAAPAT